MNYKREVEGKIQIMKTDWMFYNHAVISILAPHKQVDLTEVENGSIWKGWGGAILCLHDGQKSMIV